MDVCVRVCVRGRDVYRDAPVCAPAALATARSTGADGARRASMRAQAAVEQAHPDATRLSDAYPGLSIVAYVLLLSLTSLLSFVAWLSVLQLFTFHLGLIYRGMTTYEFIVSQVHPPGWATNSGGRARVHACMRGGAGGEGVARGRGGAG